jgi:hypothetical protein
MGAFLPHKEGLPERIQIDLGQVSAILEVILEVFEDDRLGNGVELIGGEILEGGSLLEELLDHPLDIGKGLFAWSDWAGFHVPDTGNYE